ncbi:sensor histidine kinase [Rossellomorea aquimaris]|uniref:ATP-binding protein n=1 Tax=Rossellomorea aquimaris TaxID=189382 RepID=UPI001CD7E318|nr:sensor histidine kinase [Rossellomorea aquimaris]MCA1055828.1 sensor histidine kinase [Rossellomorea aquimaris]
MVHTELFNGLLINLLVILIVILLVNFYHLSNQKVFINIRLSSFLIYILSTFLIILSMLLSVELEDGLFYDLRFIPFLLGGIYGGRKVLPPLAVTMIATRFVFMGSGVASAIVLTLLSAIAVYYLLPTLSEKSWVKRVYWFTCFSFCYSLLAFLLPLLMMDYRDFSAFSIYSFTLAASTFFVFYLCEMIRTTYMLQLEAIKYEKMQVVSHLAASMSHEVRNPLTTVKGFLQLINENPSDAPTNTELSKIAVSEIDRATEVINQYLNFAKPHPEVKVEVDVTREIGRSNEIIMPLAVKKGVIVEMDILHHRSILGDPNKLQQVLINVMKNGIEAMDSGGVLKILSYEKAGRLVVEIADNGIGMTREQVMRLGEPYFSLKGKNGTGLGMMTVFQLAAAMEGTVKVHSKKNKGTSIILSFPVSGEDMEKEII